MMPNRDSTPIKATLNTEEEVKHKQDADRLGCYWRFILPLCLILAFMVIFPLRIALPGLECDVIFNGSISLICAALAIRVYQRFGGRRYRLISVLLLCFMLSGWQVFDLLVLRTGSPGVWGFGPGMSQSFTDYDGLAWYELRFPNEEIMCNSLFEQYWGNQILAITVRINRDATWFACGG